jgi:antitoxin component YwqK of YwqJK toxin-antitoxin module
MNKEITLKAVQQFYQSGKLKLIIYFNDKDQKHNEFGPAAIHYFEDGNKESEYHYVNDIQHNSSGPAVILYNRIGILKIERYYLNGVKFSREDFLKETSKQNDSCENKIIEVDGKKYKLSAV